MDKVVTIGIPIYKRLEFIPNVLRTVAAQDYPHIDLLISDNGMNGNSVKRIVDQHYTRPYRFRQNSETVSGSSHYNQLIENAAGEYVVILADDDEISPNFVSGLMQVFEKHPAASVALAREEILDFHGKVHWQSRDTVPEIMRGEDFIRSTWKTREYGYQSLCTFLAKTEKLKELGGFPEIWRASGDEDILMIKLVLGSSIGFNTRCAFRKRFFEESGGLAISLQDLARGMQEFLSTLDSDETISRYAAAHPREWKELRSYVAGNAWGIYYSRWANMYKERLSIREWLAGARALPLSKYGRSVTTTIAGACVSASLEQFKRLSPQTYSFCKKVKLRLARLKA